MRYLKLRIAWSVVWSVVAVLLVVLWVRSYTWTDLVILSSNRGMASGRGMIETCAVNIAPSPALQRLISFQGTIANDTPPDYSLFGFGYSPTPSLPRVRIPYWFPVVLSVAISALPWLRVPARFTIRTLLVATTLVAIGLGLIVAVV